MSSADGPGGWPGVDPHADPDKTEPIRRRLPGATTQRPREMLGAYELLDQVGEGGMGVVYRAKAPDGQYVALKALRPYIAHDPDARARLRREVASLRRVRAPGVAALLDADVDGPRPYLVTEFVSGPPLDKVVANEGPFTDQRLADLAQGLADALGAIHRAGVIHRDLKPGNVLVGRDGPVLIDFGISHVAEDSRLTMTGLVMGTPGYLSPEMVEGGEVTQAADWWGWAATLAYAASGTPPFGRGQMTAVLDRVLRGQADLSGVDDRIRPLLAAALSPDPASRPGTQQVLHELRVYAAGGYTTGLPVTQPPPATPPTAPLRPDTTKRLPANGVPAAGYAASAGRVAPASRPPAQVHAAHYWAPAQPAPVAQPAPYEPAPRPAPPTDPRIGRSPRSGTLAALLVGVVALSAVAPVAAWAALLIWSFVARWVDRAMTAMVVRRFDAGRRSTDPFVAAAAAPWQAFIAAISTVVAAILPAVVGVAGAVATALGVAVLHAGDPQLGRPLPIAVGVLLATALSWWGPGGQALRRGSRSIVRAVAPQPVISRVLVVLVLAVAVGCGVRAATHWREAPSWWPYSSASEIPGSGLIPTLPSIR
ncbi:serine/threonine protein kinase [Branchiibius sp. NY16-3462-2]|uniref:serine/threonine protein kinase n=1 Tax=Branchiibius sp. NY16-3462-2 TaxID=1807500 RepID=UPI0007941B37|nr:serine/threonine protein kinase [Branchiibius sp. NY16-3462-2]KYH44888.1 hypothetical protein AZH51_01805 [Branchiibius sp. NY16-3462-2]